MNYFTYKDNQLFAEDVAVSDLAARLGTPLYIYSARTLRRHYRVLRRGLQGHRPPHLFCDEGALEPEHSQTLRRPRRGF